MFGLNCFLLHKNWDTINRALICRSEKIKEQAYQSVIFPSFMDFSVKISIAAIIQMLVKQLVYSRKQFPTLKPETEILKSAVMIWSQILIIRSTKMNVNIIMRLFSCIPITIFGKKNNMRKWSLLNVQLPTFSTYVSTYFQWIMKRWSR